MNNQDFIFQTPLHFYILRDIFGINVVWSSQLNLISRVQYILLVKIKFYLLKVHRQEWMPVLFLHQFHCCCHVFRLHMEEMDLARNQRLVWFSYSLKTQTSPPPFYPPSPPSQLFPPPKPKHVPHSWPEI